MTEADKLRAAWSLIDTPDKWTQGADARDRSGRPVDLLSRAAVCFCVVGARKRAGARLVYLVEAIDGRSVITFNDHPDTTHDDIRALFERAIKLAEAEQ